MNSSNVTIKVQNVGFDEKYVSGERKKIESKILIALHLLRVSPITLINVNKTLSIKVPARDFDFDRIMGRVIGGDIMISFMENKYWGIFLYDDDIVINQLNVRIEN